MVGCELVNSGSSCFRSAIDGLSTAASVIVVVLPPPPPPPAPEQAPATIRMVRTAVNRTPAGLAPARPRCERGCWSVFMRIPLVQIRLDNVVNQSISLDLAQDPYS